MKTEYIPIITALISAISTIVIAVINSNAKKTSTGSKKSSANQTWMIIFAVLFFASLGYIFLGGGETTTDTVIHSSGVHQFEGSIRFVQESGEEMPASFSNVRGIRLESTAKKGNYKLNQPYPSGTKFKLYLDAVQDAYVYAIAANDKGEINVLFPYSEGNSTFTQGSTGEIAIPKGNVTMTLDNNPGIELFCLLYAAQEIDIEKLERQLERHKEIPFSKRLYQALADKIIEPEAIHYANKRIAFSAESKKTVLPIIVVFEHIN